MTRTQLNLSSFDATCWLGLRLLSPTGVQGPSQGFVRGQKDNSNSHTTTTTPAGRSGFQGNPKDSGPVSGLKNQTATPKAPGPKDRPLAKKSTDLTGGAMGQPKAKLVAATKDRPISKSISGAPVKSSSSDKNTSHTRDLKGLANAGGFVSAPSDSIGNEVGNGSETNSFTEPRATTKVQKNNKSTAHQNTATRPVVLKPSAANQRDSKESRSPTAVGPKGVSPLNKWYELSRKLVKGGQQPLIQISSPLQHKKNQGPANSAATPPSLEKPNSRHVGIVNIICTHNNTIINLTDNYGNVIISRTPRQLGFKGTKRSTSYAASVAAEQVYQTAVLCQFHNIVIQVKGFGPGRSSSLYILTKRDLSILRIVDLTPLPHNGCRAPKKRRI